MTSPVKRPHAATRSRGEPVGKRYKWQVLVTVVFGTFMVILDGTAVNVALPTLQHVFNTSVDQVDGVIIAYTLASGVTIPVTGFVAERFGSKRTYLTALALFVVGSACCALAPSLAWLVGFRVLQGVGGGMLAPLGIALLFDATPPQERGLANGIFGLPLVLRLTWTFPVFLLQAEKAFKSRASFVTHRAGESETCWRLCCLGDDDLNVHKGQDENIRPGWDLSIAPGILRIIS
jgi:MFS family permease